ncbi:unnamed protein product, partial [Iphiclides podalirius]
MSRFSVGGSRLCRSVVRGASASAPVRGMSSPLGCPPSRRPPVPVFPTLASEALTAVCADAVREGSHPKAGPRAGRAGVIAPPRPPRAARSRRAHCSRTARTSKCTALESSLLVAEDRSRAPSRYRSRDVAPPLPRQRAVTNGNGLTQPQFRDIIDVDILRDKRIPKQSKPDVPLILFALQSGGSWSQSDVVISDETVPRLVKLGRVGRAFRALSCSPLTP